VQSGLQVHARSHPARPSSPQPSDNASNFFFYQHLRQKRTKGSPPSNCDAASSKAHPRTNTHTHIHTHTHTHTYTYTHTIRTTHTTLTHTRIGCCERPLAKTQRLQISRRSNRCAASSAVYWFPVTAIVDQPYSWIRVQKLRTYWSAIKTNRIPFFNPHLSLLLIRCKVANFLVAFQSSAELGVSKQHSDTREFHRLDRKPKATIQ
jgi:hypothetical protein